MFGLDFLDALRCREVFRHRTAKFFDGFADFCADFSVGLVGLVFAGNFFAAQFILCLSGAEEIGGQFGAPHVVEDLLTFPSGPCGGG